MYKFVGQYYLHVKFNDLVLLDKKFSGFFQFYVEITNTPRCCHSADIDHSESCQKLESDIYDAYSNVVSYRNSRGNSMVGNFTPIDLCIGLPISSIEKNKIKLRIKISVLHSTQNELKLDEDEIYNRIFDLDHFLDQPVYDRKFVIFPENSFMVGGDISLYAGFIGITPVMPLELLNEDIISCRKLFHNMFSAYFALCVQLRQLYYSNNSVDEASAIVVGDASVLANKIVSTMPFGDPEGLFAVIVRQTSYYFSMSYQYWSELVSQTQPDSMKYLNDKAHKARMNWLTKGCYFKIRSVDELRDGTDNPVKILVDQRKLEKKPPITCADIEIASDLVIFEEIFLPKDISEKFNQAHRPVVTVGKSSEPIKRRICEIISSCEGPETPIKLTRISFVSPPRIHEFDKTNVLLDCHLPRMLPFEERNYKEIDILSDGIWFDGYSYRTYCLPASEKYSTFVTHYNTVCHLIVAIHGLEGSWLDVSFVRAYMELVCSSNPPLVIYPARCISGEASTAGMEESAQKIAEEIKLFIRNNRFTPARVSFIGHSMGAIIARIIVTLPVFRPLTPFLYTFVSLAGPHLGVIPHTSWIVSAGLNFIQRFKKSKAIFQMQLKDDLDPRKCLLYRLSKSNGLALFKTVIFVANPQDKYVPFHSSHLDPLPPNLRSSRLSNVYEEMRMNFVNLFMENAEKCIFLRYTAYSDTFYGGSFLDFGRTAHIAGVDCELFIEKLFSVFLARFFRN